MAIQQNELPNVLLSTVHPDKDDIKQQLQILLAGKESWKDLLYSSTGDALFDFISGIGAYDQFSIESALEEGYFDTAKFKSSIYAKARSQGARLSRKLPGTINISLTRDLLQTGTSSFTIPAYSNFTVDGISLFNRETIYFPENSATLTCTLHQGNVVINTLYGNGATFQRYVSQERDFTVSDTDVFVRVNNIDIPVTQKGLWHFKGNEKAVQDRTTKDGQLILIFGNDYYAYLPPIGSTVVVMYAVTQGLSANTTSVIGSKVTYSGNSYIVGEALTGITSGSDEPFPEVYKYISPHIYSGGDKATTENQYTAYAKNYPGVIDALLLGQRHIAPGVKEYMNLVRCSLLTTTPWSDAQFEEFKTTFYKESLHPLELYEEKPQARNFNLDVLIAVKNTGDATNVKVNVRNVLEQFVALKYGSIGKRIYLSDLYQLIVLSHQDILYANIRQPTTNIISNLEMLNVVSSIDETPSTISDTQGTYWITAVDANGKECLPYLLNVSYISGQSVKLQWEKHPYAVNYRVYGRNKNGLGFLYQTANTSWIDDGTLSPTAGLPPEIDLTGVYYPQCISINIDTIYADTLTR